MRLTFVDLYMHVYATMGSTVEPVCSGPPWAKIFSLNREVASINWQIKCIVG